MRHCEYRAQDLAGAERHKVHWRHHRKPEGGDTRVYVWQKKGGLCHRLRRLTLEHYYR